MSNIQTTTMFSNVKEAVYAAATYSPAATATVAVGTIALGAIYAFPETSNSMASAVTKLASDATATVTSLFSKTVAKKEKEVETDNDAAIATALHNELNGEVAPSDVEKTITAPKEEVKTEAPKKSLLGRIASIPYAIVKGIYDLVVGTLKIIGKILYSPIALMTWLFSKKVEVVKTDAPAVATTVAAAATVLNPTVIEPTTATVAK